MDDYPLLGAFLTVVWFFLMLAWISALFMVLRDIFRSPDLSGAAKAGWTLLVVIIPWLGVLVYLVARGDSMHMRDAQEASQREAALQEYLRSAVANPPASPTGDGPAVPVR